MQTDHAEFANEPHREAPPDEVPHDHDRLSDVSVVIPAKNEAPTIGQVVRALAELGVLEVLVIDDASTDGTGEVAEQAGARVIRHSACLGNGAAVKSGARQATGRFLALMDADGQHDPRDLSRLVRRARSGLHLVIGTRTATAHASRLRRFGNAVYNRLASWISGQTILDLTSGYRVAERNCFCEFLQMLPNGFSYPTTSTMAFLRSGYGVAFEPINVGQREDKSTSHINVARDGGRFLLIIFRIAALYSPLKVFFPTALGFFASGVVYYVYTFVSDGRFTNFGALLLSSAVIIFLIGLVSEQVTMLLYATVNRRGDERGD